MTTTNPIRSALAAPTPTTRGHQRLTKVAQTFEGILWSEVVDTMLATHLGPTGLGEAGSTYQHMLWRMITQRDFGSVDHSMTQATLQQLTARNPDPAGPVARAASPLPGASPVSPRAAVPTSSSTLDWARKAWKHIVSGAHALAVPAEALLAQSALETNWGRDSSAHNLFGIKSHGDAPSFIAATHEYVDGALRETQAAFRRYVSDAQAVLDYVTTIRSRHPQAVGQSTVKGFATALQATGYATDPDYAAKIEAIANSPRMQALLRAVQEAPTVTNNARVKQP